MNETRGNAWDLLVDFDLLFITTNGFIKNNGDAVMGRGIALEAKKRYPNIARLLGKQISQEGNHVHLLSSKLASFPVKHDWREKADIKLIERSARQAIQLANEHGLERILLPRPGCGNGGLNWRDVKLSLINILDERFYIVSF